MRLWCLCAIVACREPVVATPTSFARAPFAPEYSRCPDGQFRSHWWTATTGTYFEELEAPSVVAESYPLTAQNSLEGVTWRGIARLTANSRGWFRRSGASGTAGGGNWSEVEAPAFDVVLPMRQARGIWYGPDWGLVHDGESASPPAGCGTPGDSSDVK